MLNSNYIPIDRICSLLQTEWHRYAGVRGLRSLYRPGCLTSRYHRHYQAREIPSLTPLRPPANTINIYKGAPLSSLSHRATLNLQWLQFSDERTTYPAPLHLRLDYLTPMLSVHLITPCEYRSKL